MAEVVIRPMRPEDVPSADRVCWAAIGEGIPEEFKPDDDVRAPRGRARIAHLLATDPAGAWVAEADGAVVGVALALVRDGIWGLSLLAVAAEQRGRALGRRLLEAALTYAEGTRGGIILSSEHPAAMRSYARAGFALLPAIAMAGQVRHAVLPADNPVRPADLAADARMMDAVAREVRGASYAPDLPVLGSLGCELLVLDDRGFAAYRDGTTFLLAARDDEAATLLLQACFAATPDGGGFHLDFITAGNDWAIRAGLEAGLALTPDGPVFVRGEVGTLRPFLPSGALL